MWLHVLLVLSPNSPSPIPPQSIISIEYHWIYRFVVQDESIPFMDESCGYIEQVDDRTVFGFVSGKDLRGNLTTVRRREQGQKVHGMRRHKFRGHRRRQHSQKDDNCFDSNVRRNHYSNKRSLLDDQDDEENPTATNISGPSNDKISAADNPLDEECAEDLQKTGIIT